MIKIIRPSVAQAVQAGLSRRQLGLGLAATTAATLLPRSASAQTASDLWAKFAQLSADARKLGLSVPMISAPPKGENNYRELLPALVDFTDRIDEAAQKSTVFANEIAALKRRASDLLQDINRAEKAPRQKSDWQLPGGASRGGHGLLALLAPPALAQDAVRDAKFRKYHDGYLKLFDSCKVKPEHRTELDWYMSKLTSPKYRARYETVANAVCVPWYFIGIVHALEASLNFEGHLHNGDPLSERTVQVPADRPKVWGPPSDWEASARDALDYEGFTNQSDWSLAHTLFRYEAYNGFRSRELHDINTPYLWSFSTHYDGGKFVADGVWSDDAVSKQCGAGVLLRELVVKNVINFTA
jgi:lysozyme family protein